MNRSLESTKRTYESPLRAEQAAATRKRILDAFLAEAAAGAIEVSIPAIARRAKVSVPTVYRHFPTRGALFEAMVAELDRAMGVPPPAEPHDLARFVRGFFVRQDEIQAKYGALRNNALAWQIRREVTVPRRRGLVDDMIARLAPGAREPVRSWLSDLLVVLVSTAMSDALRDYVGARGAKAADRVGWAIEALVAHAGGEVPMTAPKAATSKTGNKKKRRRA